MPISSPEFSRRPTKMQRSPKATTPKSHYWCARGPKSPCWSYSGSAAPSCRVALSTHFSVPCIPDPKPYSPPFCSRLPTLAACIPSIRQNQLSGVTTRWHDCDPLATSPPSLQGHLFFRRAGKSGQTGNRGNEDLQEWRHSSTDRWSTGKG